MQVEHCEFPEDVYFDVENDTWLRPLSGGRARIGITSVLSFLAGPLQSVKLKTELTQVSSDQSLGTLESGKYFGAIKSPASGRIAGFNPRVQENPRVVNDSPYEDGWIAEMESFDQSSLSHLLLGESARARLEARIRELKVRCFKVMPDEQLVSVGVGCSTTLANLNEALAPASVGRVVHLVTDDPTADIEMVRWSDRTKNDLVETRQEANLFHFIVRKTHE